MVTLHLIMAHMFGINVLTFDYSLWLNKNNRNGNGLQEVYIQKSDQKRKHGEKSQCHDLEGSHYPPLQHVFQWVSLRLWSGIVDDIW